jgi:hypothetical protein
MARAKSAGKGARRDPLDPLVAQIVAMLGETELERRIAAAIVLGELEVGHDEVLDGLAAVLTEEGPLAGYALDALAKLAPRKLARYVTPLLDAQDAELRGRATALLAGQGKQAAKRLAAELDAGSAQKRREIVKLLAADPSPSIGCCRCSMIRRWASRCCIGCAR